jgi:putative membrane protein
MILPGISGAFILLLLGAYQSILDTINQLRDGVTTLDWKLFSDAFVKILVFGLGAIIGIKIFSKALNWMFSNHKNIILAILTGFMIGALNKIWPWKEVLEYRMNSHGEKVPFLETSVLPTSYAGEPFVIYAILFMIIGFLLIFILERVSVNKKNTND